MNDQVNQVNPIEWEFGAPADQVNFDRLADELLSIPIVGGLAYLATFKKNAPITYKFFKQHQASERVKRYFVLE